MADVSVVVPAGMYTMQSSAALAGMAGATGAAAAEPAVMATVPLWSMVTRSMRGLVASAAPWVTSVCAAKGKYSPTRAWPAAMRVVSPETTEAASPLTTP
jgi:hypothetical protein